MLAVLMSLILSGCEKRSTNKEEVFQLYFHHPSPTNAVISKASNWERYSVGLDAWELNLEAELTHEFLDSISGSASTNPPPSPDAIKYLFGTSDAGSGVNQALLDKPNWFEPDAPSRFAIATNGVRLSFVTGFAVVTFDDESNLNRFQLWVSDNGWSLLFVDRQTGRVSAIHRFP